MKKNKLIGIAITTSLLLSSCSPNQPELFSCEDPDQISQQTEPENLNISIRVDGSGSMLGYVSNSQSNYVKTLQSLDDIFYSHPRVNYYRSGLDKNTNSFNQEISINLFDKAQNEEFYDESNPSLFPGVTSALAETITPLENQEQLLIIVTDLVADEAKVEEINRKVNDYYFSKPGYAAAIVGIKSEFDGKVYVTSEGKINSFEHEKDRPFYLLWLGPHQTIIDYLKQLKKTENFPDNSEIVIFAPHNLVQDFVYLDGEVNSSSDENVITKKNHYLGSGQSKVEAEDERSQLWEIIDRNKKIDISDSVSISLSEYSLAIKTNSIITNSQVEFFSNYSPEGKDVTQNFKNSSAIKLHSWKISEDKTQLSFINTINTNKFTKSGTYLFTVDIVAKDLKIPVWWAEWSQDVGSPNDGSKTQNLSRLLKRFTSPTITSIQGNSNVIGRFCYAFWLK